MKLLDKDGLTYYTGKIKNELTDYVKFMDYATSSKGGTIKSGYYGLQVDSNNGKAYCDTYTYANYGNVENQRFVSKGTLENVITGKNLYSKPSSGIPKIDLASDVQTSLGKADTALQEHQDISGKEDKTNKVTSIDNTSTDTQYPSAKAVYDYIQSLNGDEVNY